jgi:hypothetical protein
MFAKTKSLIRPLFAAFIVMGLSLVQFGPAAAGGLLGYEPAYYNGQTYTINAIEVKQNPTQYAQADFYEVEYPQLALDQGKTPQCDPCDHQGNGITPDDFHDHVLDSIPSSPGHGEYNALWHVYLVIPFPGKESEYTALLPMASETAINQAIAAGVAIKIDTNFYFICDVVSPNAVQ